MILLAKLRREILVAFSKLGLKRATVYRGKTKFKIPLFHGMGRFLFVTNEPWRKRTLKAVAKMNPRTVLDIGVNVGQTMLDIKEIIPKATYFGFEPNPACVFYTNEVIRLNNFTNASILPFGLGQKTEMAHLYSSAWDDASSSVLKREDAEYSSVIYTKNGDEFIAQEDIADIAFIKIDTEGYEFLVIQGLEKTIDRDQPIVFCEIFAGKKENPKIYEFFQSKDYHIYEQASGFQLQRMNEDEIFTNSCNDYIFAPRKKSEEFEKHFTND